MPYYRTTRVIPLIFTILIVAGAIAALVSVARIVFFNGKSNETFQVEDKQKALIAVSAERAVKMIVRGPIVGEEDFRSYSIELGTSKRTFTVYKGYREEVISSQVLSNSTKAYGEFVYSLYHNDFLKNIQETSPDVDLRGVCPSGYLYVFETIKSKKTENLLWTTNCQDINGNLGIKYRPISKLFIAQIPESDDIIDKLW